MSTIETKPADGPADASTLGTPAMPDVTPGITTPTTTPASPEPQRDKTGATWDATVHESPPRISTHTGCWARLRGNAARKAKGLPPTGHQLTGGRVIRKPAPDPAAANPAPAAAATPAEPPPVAASTPPPPEALAGPPIRDGIPDPAPLERTLESYQPTARGVVDGSLGLAQMFIGPAWEAKPAEHQVLVGGVQRVLHHYQAPQLGPVLDLVLIVVGFVVKRQNDPQTREKAAGFWSWLTRRPIMPKPAAPAAAAPISPPPAAPAAQPRSVSPYANLEAPADGERASGAVRWG